MKHPALPLRRGAIGPSHDMVAAHRIVDHIQEQNLQQRQYTLRETQPRMHSGELYDPMTRAPVSRTRHLDASAQHHLAARSANSYMTPPPPVESSQVEDQRPWVDRVHPSRVNTPMDVPNPWPSYSPPPVENNTSLIGMSPVSQARPVHMHPNQIQKGAKKEIGATSVQGGVLKRKEAEDKWVPVQQGQGSPKGQPSSDDSGGSSTVASGRPNPNTGVRYHAPHEAAKKRPAPPEHWGSGGLTTQAVSPGMEPTGFAGKEPEGSAEQTKRTPLGDEPTQAMPSDQTTVEDKTVVSDTPGATNVRDRRAAIAEKNRRIQASKEKGDSLGKNAEELKAQAKKILDRKEFYDSMRSWQQRGMSIGSMLNDRYGIGLANALMRQLGPSGLGQRAAEDLWRDAQKKASEKAAEAKEGEGKEKVKQAKLKRERARMGRQWAREKRAEEQMNAYKGLRINFFE